jgi:ankyrin repeat protein
VNKPEKREGSSPLIIAAKRNQKNIFNFLLQNGAEINHRNNLNLNALDYAIIHGNYEIAYNLKHNNKDLNLKSLDEYIQLNRQMQVPCFNIPVFYQSLLDDVEPTHTPSFVLTNEERKNMEGKIPDPNETWGDFFKRMLKFELYKPPMIDKKDVAFKDRSTFYMTVQTKLLEMEYNKESKL